MFCRAHNRVACEEYSSCGSSKLAPISNGLQMKLPMPWNWLRKEVSYWMSRDMLHVILPTRQISLFDGLREKRNVVAVRMKSKKPRLNHQVQPKISRNLKQ